MSRTTLLQERRMQTFQNVLGHWQARRLSALEAAEMLGMSERSFRRYRRRHEDDGLDGLFDRRLDKASARRVPADRIEWVLEQYRTRHTGWTVKHFHDHLCAHHGFAWSYTWTKTALQHAGLVSKAPRRGAHRRRRRRKPCVGMMLHQDGSRHEWLAGQAACDLIVTMDDATSEIYSAFLVEEEGTASTFRALRPKTHGFRLPHDDGEHRHGPVGGDRRRAQRGEPVPNIPPVNVGDLPSVEAGHDLVLQVAPVDIERSGLPEPSVSLEHGLGDGLEEGLSGIAGRVLSTSDRGERSDRARARFVQAHGRGVAEDLGHGSCRSRVARRSPARPPPHACQHRPAAR